MEALDLLILLECRGVIFRVEGKGLAYDAPAGIVDPATLATLRERKPELLRVLADRGDLAAKRAVVTTWPDDYKAFWQEYVDGLRQGGNPTPEAVAWATLQVGVDFFAARDQDAC